MFPCGDRKRLPPDGWRACGARGRDGCNVDESLQHFDKHVEIHLVVPIDQFDLFTVLAVQFHHVGVAAAVVEDRYPALELCGRDREADR